MLVSFREPIGAVTTTEMKPLGWKTNSLIRTARAAALREKTTRKKRLTDRARTFRKSGLDVQKNMRRPAAGAFFYLTSPFIGHVTNPRCALTILARHNPTERHDLDSSTLRDNAGAILHNAVSG